MRSRVSCSLCWTNATGSSYGFDLSKDVGGEEGKDAASPANAFVVVCGIRFCSFVVVVVVVVVVVLCSDALVVVRFPLGS